MVRHLSAMQETWVWSLGWEDPWRWTRQLTAVFLPVFYPLHCQYSSSTEEPSRPQFMGLQKVRHDWVTRHSTQRMNWWRWIMVVCPGILLVDIILNVLYFLWESEEVLYILFDLSLVIKLVVYTFITEIKIPFKWYVLPDQREFISNTFIGFLYFQWPSDYGQIVDGNLILHSGL